MLITINSQTTHTVYWWQHISPYSDSLQCIFPKPLNSGIISPEAICPISDRSVACSMSPISHELHICWYPQISTPDMLPQLPARLPWQSSGAWFWTECLVQSPTQVSGMVASEWGVQWSSGTNGSLRQPLCQVKLLWSGESFGAGHMFASMQIWGFFTHPLAHWLSLLLLMHSLQLLLSPFHLVWSACWVLAKKESRGFSQLNWTWASWIHCSAEFPSSRLGTSTHLSWSVVSTSLPSHGLSCEEGLLDTLGGDAFNVSDSTGMALDSSPRRSCRDGINCVRVLGISSVLRPMSFPLQSLLSMIEFFQSLLIMGVDLSLCPFAFLLQIPDLCLYPLQAFSKTSTICCTIHWMIGARLVVLMLIL